MLDTSVRTRSRYYDVFSCGSPTDLHKAALGHWIKERLPKGPAEHKETLAKLFTKYARQLVPTYVAKWRKIRQRILKVYKIIDSVRQIATTPIWSVIVCLSEGRFKRDIWSGMERDRRLLVSAARALREFLSGEQTQIYEEA